MVDPQLLDSLEASNNNGTLISNSALHYICRGFILPLRENCRIILTAPTTEFSQVTDERKIIVYLWNSFDLWEIRLESLCLGYVL